MMNGPVDSQVLDAVGAWLLTYLLHSTALLVPALLLSRWLGGRSLSLQESVLRVALVGGLVTASMQVGFGWEAATGSLPYPSVRRAAGTEALPAPPRELSMERAAISETRETALGGSRVSSGPSGGSELALPWLTLLIGLWLTAALLLLVRLVVLAARLGRRLSGRSELTRGGTFRLLWRLLAVADIDRPTRLSRSARLDVPIALGLGWREICLPQRVVEELPQEQQETVLAHELAHLERRDPVWLLGSRLVESLLFVQPLNRVVRVKLQEIAEYRCDDWAAKHTGRPLTLAKCLTAVATWSVDRRVAALAPTMAGRRSGLGRRVRRLLDPAYSALDPRLPAWWRPIALVGLVVVLVAVPGFSTAERQEAPQAAPAIEESEERQTPSLEPAPAAPRAIAGEPAPQPAPAPQTAPVPAVEPAPAPRPEPAIVPIPLVALAPAIEPLVAPAAEVRLAVPVTAPRVVRVSVAPQIVARTVRGMGLGAAPAVPQEQAETEADAERSEAPAEQDVEEDARDRELERQIEMELEALEDELDAVLDELEETIDGELEGVAEEIEREMELLEAELEEGLEEQLEQFEELLEIDMEAFEVEMERLEEQLEDRFDAEGREELALRLERDLGAMEESVDRLMDRLDGDLDRIGEGMEHHIERMLEPLVHGELEPRLEAMQHRVEIEAERLEELAEQLSREARAAGERHLSEEARQELLEEARRVAEAARPTPEELETLQQELRALSESMRPSAEELDRMREELREQLEELRARAAEGLERERQELSRLRDEVDDAN